MERLETNQKLAPTFYCVFRYTDDNNPLRGPHRKVQRRMPERDEGNMFPKNEFLASFIVK